MFDYLLQSVRMFFMLPPKPLDWIQPNLLSDLLTWVGHAGHIYFHCFAHPTQGSSGEVKWVCLSVMLSPKQLDWIQPNFSSDFNLLKQVGCDKLASDSAVIYLCFHYLPIINISLSMGFQSTHVRRFMEYMYSEKRTTTWIEILKKIVKGWLLWCIWILWYCIIFLFFLPTD